MSALLFCGIQSGILASSLQQGIITPDNSEKPCHFASIPQELVVQIGKNILAQSHKLTEAFLPFLLTCKVFNQCRADIIHDTNVLIEYGGRSMEKAKQEDDLEIKKFWDVQSSTKNKHTTVHAMIIAAIHLGINNSDWFKKDIIENIKEKCKKTYRLRRIFEALVAYNAIEIITLCESDQKLKGKLAKWIAFDQSRSKRYNIENTARLLSHYYQPRSTFFSKKLPLPRNHIYKWQEFLLCIEYKRQWHYCDIPFLNAMHQNADKTLAWCLHKHPEWIPDAKMVSCREIKEDDQCPHEVIYFSGEIDCLPCAAMTRNCSSETLIKNALHIAAYKNNPELAQLLYKENAKIAKKFARQRDMDGNFPLDVAFREENHDMITFLAQQNCPFHPFSLKNNAFLNIISEIAASNSGCQPHLAKKRRRSESVSDEEVLHEK